MYMAYIYTNSEGKMLNVSQTSYKLLNLTHGTVGRWRHFYRSKLVTLVHLPVTQKKDVPTCELCSTDIADLFVPLSGGRGSGFADEQKLTAE